MLFSSIETFCYLSPSALRELPSIRLANVQVIPTQKAKLFLDCVMTRPSLVNSFNLKVQKEIQATNDMVLI